jgi:hypothetical protein
MRVGVGGLREGESEGAARRSMGEVERAVVVVARRRKALSIHFDESGEARAGRGSDFRSDSPAETDEKRHTGIRFELHTAAAPPASKQKATVRLKKHEERKGKKERGTEKGGNDSGGSRL